MHAPWGIVLDSSSDMISVMSASLKLTSLAFVFRVVFSFLQKTNKNNRNYLLFMKFLI